MLLTVFSQYPINPIITHHVAFKLAQASLQLYSIKIPVHQKL